MLFFDAKRFNFARQREKKIWYFFSSFLVFLCFFWGGVFVLPPPPCSVWPDKVRNFIRPDTTCALSVVPNSAKSGHSIFRWFYVTQLYCHTRI